MFFGKKKSAVKKETDSEMANRVADLEKRIKVLECSHNSTMFSSTMWYNTLECKDCGKTLEIFWDDADYRKAKAKYHRKEAKKYEKV